MREHDLNKLYYFYDIYCVMFQLAEEQNKLEAIKQAKIEALKKSGLPKKYLAELERKKFHA